MHAEVHMRRHKDREAMLAAMYESGVIGMEVSPQSSKLQQPGGVSRVIIRLSTCDV